MHLKNSVRKTWWLPVLAWSLVGPLGAAPGDSPDEGLVSYWGFESSLNDVSDLYTAGTGLSSDDLTAQLGTPRYVAGMVGQALALGNAGGDPAFLDAPDSADVDLAAAYTVEAWIYPTLLDESWQRLVLRWRADGMSYHFALRLVGADWTVSLFHQQGDGATTVNADGGVVQLNQWQHIAGVADGTFIRVYLNGIQVASVPYDGTIHEGTGIGLGVGDMPGGDGLRFNGYLDEVAIWDLPLTEDEILSHYEAGAEGYGLQLLCEEELDSVTIAGPASAGEGDTVEVTASMGGVDPGHAATYAWELVSGVATLGPTNGATLSVTVGDPGSVVLRVAVGDGLCTDTASATHTIAVLPSGDPGISPDEGLVSYWSFDADTADEASGYTNHSGTAADHLTPQGGALRLVPGVVGTAVALDQTVGDALLLSAPDSADVDLPSTYTIEAWIYPTELTDSWQRLVLRWGGVAALHSYHFSIRNNTGFVNAVSLFHSQSNGTEINTNGGTVQPLQWQHVAGVADGAFLRVYLNGVEVDAIPYDGTIREGTAEGLGVGDSATASGTIHYNGYLDELAIWNIPLTADELLSHYEAGTAGYGLTTGCSEERDGVTISGPAFGTIDQQATLTAVPTGMDPGAQVTYTWELISGTASLGPTNQAALQINSSEVGRVVVKVSVGDGRCDDLASATRTLSFFSGVEGLAPDHGLVSYWSLDDSLVDEAANFPIYSGVADDTLAAQGGTARFVPGVVGNAAALGATVDDPLWLNAPDSADVDLPATYSLEAWIYPTALDEGWQRLVLRWQVGLSYHFALRLVGTDWMVSLFHNQADGVQLNADGGQVRLGEWQHVAGVADGELLKVYLNGEEVGSIPYDGTILQGTGVGLGVGDMVDGAGLRYNGYMDELAMWNVPLSAGQIQSHYRAGPAGYGLESGCGEELDRVTITGPTTGTMAQPLTLTAAVEGVDPGASAAYQWELLSGVANLGPTNQATLSITAADAGEVTVRVTAGDGVCEDSATDEYTVTFFTGLPGSSPDEGLLSFWDFDDTTLDNAFLFDSNVGEVDDDLVPQEGAERYVEGMRGNSLAVGVDVGDPTFLSAPDSADVDLPATYTIEAWIYPTELASAWQRLVLRWGGVGLNSYHFAIRNEGGFTNAVSLFHAQADGTEPSVNGGTVKLAQWQHIAGVADGEFLRVYLNGEEVASVPYDGTIVAETGEALGIGDSATAFAPDLRYNGRIDELAIWDIPLTPAELLSHYQAGPGGYGLGEGPTEPRFKRGDANADGDINITDGIYVLNYLFLGGETPKCIEAANPNDDADVNITDGIYVLNYLFLGGPEPAPPGPAACGLEPPDTPNFLGCQSFPPCGN